MNNLKFMDFEVFPHWWCCTVSDEEEHYPGGTYNNKFDIETEKQIKNKMRVYTSDDPDAAKKLQEDLSHGVICGYNIKKYDMIIAKCIFAGFSPEKLKIANDIIIGRQNNPDIIYTTPMHTRIASFIKFGWSGAEAWQDLLDDSEKSLKDKECSLGMDIRETTVPFDKEDLTEQDKAEIIFYNKHDVYALHVFYVTTSKAYIDTKVQLCETFGIDKKIGYKNTNANLCGKVLNAERAHGTNSSDKTITIRDAKLKEYFDKWLPQEIFDWLTGNQEKYNRTFNLFENVVDVADGGLHSVYELPDGYDGLYVEANEDWAMYNVDVSSCYPSVMLFCNSMSRGAKNPERFKYIYERRLTLKNTPKSQWTEQDKIFVPAAKLVLNTTYGAMGNKYLDLYDEYMRTKVCRLGQIILLSISNHLYQSIPDLKVIQTNTDGVLVYARRQYYEQIKAIVDEFSAISNFAFEIEEDKKLWQLNVNNYVAIHDDDSIKAKGGAFVTEVYQQGTNKLRPLGNFCIPKAQIDFLTKGTNPIQHLLTNNNVSDFCLTCTKGPSYDTMVQEVNNNKIELGKVSRVIATTVEEFGIIKKIGINKRKGPNYGNLKEDTVALCPPHPLVMNDNIQNYEIDTKTHCIVHKPTGERWPIDYAYYAAELDKALDVVWLTLRNGEIDYVNKEFNL